MWSRKKTPQQYGYQTSRSVWFVKDSCGFDVNSQQKLADALLCINDDTRSLRLRSGTILLLEQIYTNKCFHEIFQKPKLYGITEKQTKIFDMNMKDCWGFIKYSHGVYSQFQI